MLQPKRMSLITLATAGFLIAGAYQASAASTCPALPNAESTFSGALNKLIDKATGKSSTLSSAGDPVKLLNSSQQQKVLGWLRGELAGRRAAVSGDRQKSAAEQKVEDLKKRIFTRDRMERDASVVGSRIYDRSTDGTILPSSRRGKPLGQLIDEEMARDKPTLAAKYKDKYKAAILSAIEANPAAVGEFAGALSAGDYMTVADHAADWGAQGFGTIVSDALEELGHTNSKTVWDRAVKHAGAARQVVQALSNGRTDEAWKVIGDEWKKEVKEQSRAALKAAVNFAFDAGSGAGTIGDFVPIPGAAQNVIAPGTFGLTPGDLYLKLIDAEMALIEWSDNYLRTTWSKGDGECVRIYNSTYERTNSVDAAYEEFDHCSSTARYSAMFEFANQARAIGINETAAIKEFLEAHRRHQLNSSTPLQWIKARAARIAAKRKAVGQQIQPELTGVQKVLSNIAKGVGSAMENRLADLVSAVLNETQWDQLADEIRQLEKTLDETLTAIDNDLNRIRRYSGGIDQWCTAYDQQKPIARQALADGIDLSVRASRLRDRLDGIDTSACEVPETTPQESDSSARAAALAGTIKNDQAALQSAVDLVCAAPGDIRQAPDKVAGRSHLDDALTNAGEARAVMARLTGNAGELSRLKSNDAGGGQDASGPTTARERVMSEIASAKGEVDTLAGEFGNLHERFKNAHDAMRDAQRRIGNITEPTQEIIEGIKECLRPLAFAPVAEKPRAILAELEQHSSRNVGCRGDILQSWNERDPDPPSGTGVTSSAAWRYRSLSISPTPDALRARLAETEAKCPAPAEVAQPSDPADRADWPDPDAVGAAASDAGSRVDRCVADALVAYQDAWGKPRIELSDATCEPQRNADILSKLRTAAADGSQEARDHISRLDPIVAAVGKAHASYGKAKQAYAAGDMAAAKASLGATKSTIDGLGGAPDCSELGAKVTSGLEKIERLDRILTEARNAVNGCNVSVLKTARQRYGGIKHSALAPLLRQGDAIVAANASYVEAKGAYSSGDLGSAQSSLNRARSALSRAGGSVCPDLSGKIGRGLSRIDRLRDAIRSAEQAVATCNVAGIERWTASLAKVSNPAASSIKGKLRGARKKCEEKVVEDRNRRCVKDHGRGYYAGPPDASGSYYCIPNQSAANAWCNANNQGTGWRARKINAKGGFDCKKSGKQQRAENNATCRAQNGPGYYVGKPRRDGTFYCLPTRRTANAQCRQLNGPGAIAGKIKFNGAVDCVWSTRARPQPRHDTQSSAAAAAAAGAIIEGIIGATGNRDRGRQPQAGGGRRPPSSARTPQRTQRTPQRTQRPPQRTKPPAKCLSHLSSTSQKMINMTDPRCKPYW